MTGRSATGDGLRAAAATLVERDPIKVVPDLGLVGVVGGFRNSGARRVSILSRGAPEHDVFSVGTPDRAGVHIAGVVRAGQSLQVTGSRVVPREDSARRIEHLKEAIVFEVDRKSTRLNSSH